MSSRILFACIGVAGGSGSVIFRGEGLRSQEDYRAAAQLAGGQLQAGVADDDFRQWQLGGFGRLKGRQHLGADVLDEGVGKGLRQGGNQHAAVPIHRDAPGGERDQPGGSLGEKIQETHKASTFTIESRTSLVARSGCQPTQKSVFSCCTRATCRCGPNASTWSSNPARKRSPRERKRSRF